MMCCPFPATASSSSNAPRNGRIYAEAILTTATTTTAFETGSMGSRSYGQNELFYSAFKLQRRSSNRARQALEWWSDGGSWIPTSLIWRKVFLPFNTASCLFVYRSFDHLRINLNRVRAHTTIRSSPLFYSHPFLSRPSVVDLSLVFLVILKPSLSPLPFVPSIPE